MGFKTRSGNSYGDRSWKQLRHRVNKIELRVEEGTVISVEASLSRVLFGSNFRLIESQDDINSGWTKLLSNIEEIVICPDYDLEFTRIDLVWHFEGDPAQNFLAHRYLRHPLVRDDPQQYGNKGLFWKGSNCKIRMYDKTLEQTGSAGSSIRLEFELHWNVLKREFNGNLMHVVNLDFNDCRRVFKKLAVQFMPKPMPHISSKEDFLALLAQENTMVSGIPAVELYVSRLCPKQAKRIRKAVASRQLFFNNIDWGRKINEVLPEHDVGANGDSKSIQPVVACSPS